jgi:hypothetical protein
MNVAGNAEIEDSKILPLFGKLESNLQDPMQELLHEGWLEMELETEITPAQTMNERLLVKEMQFPDQSLFVLEQQLADLRLNLGRMKFYLGELEDLLPT